jgi:hypothetical protein
MSGMYDEPKVSDVKLKPYPHEERGTGKVSHQSLRKDLNIIYGINTRSVIGEISEHFHS